MFDDDEPFRLEMERLEGIYRPFVHHNTLNMSGSDDDMGGHNKTKCVHMPSSWVRLTCSSGLDEYCIDSS